MANATQYRTVGFSQLVLNDSPRPDGRLVASIRQHGILEDLLVREWRGKYKVIAGNRRARAVERILEEEDWHEDALPIPIKIIPPALCLAAQVATNNLGKKNPLADLDAILSISDRLLKKGKSEKEIQTYISKELGLTAATQRQRLRLKGIPDSVREAIIEGRCAPTTAIVFMTLPAATRKKLLKKLSVEGGKLTANDVRDAQRTGRVEALDNLHLWDRMEEPIPAPAQTKVVEEFIQPIPKEITDAPSD